MASTVRNSTLSIGGTFIVPVALRKITTKGDVNFHRGCKDGAEVKRLEVNGNTGEPVTAEDIVKGFRDEDGTFYPIPAEAIATIDAATKLDSFDIDFFVPLADIPLSRATDSYYLVPAKGSSPKALRLLLDALKPIPKGAEKRGAMAGVFKLMPRSLQHLAVVYAQGDGLFVSTLAWEADFRQADEAMGSLAGLDSDKKHLEAARALVATYTEPVEAIDSLTDEVREMRAELIAQAAAGKPIEAAPASAAPKKAADDLMASLEASLVAANQRKRTAAASA
jgi:DNA end-binding protein Ku